MRRALVAHGDGLGGVDAPALHEDVGGVGERALGGGHEQLARPLADRVAEPSMVERAGAGGAQPARPAARRADLADDLGRHPEGVGDLAGGDVPAARAGVLPDAEGEGVTTANLPVVDRLGGGRRRGVDGVEPCVGCMAGGRARSVRATARMRDHAKPLILLVSYLT